MPRERRPVHRQRPVGRRGGSGGADGVHLGQGDDLAGARERLRTGQILGISVRGVDDLPAAVPFVIIGPGTVPTWVQTAGVVGEADRVDNPDPASFRIQQVAFALAKRLLDAHFTPTGDDRRPWLFPRLVRICREWVDSSVQVADGYSVGYLLTNTQRQAEAVEALWHAISVQVGARRERLRPMLRRFDPVGSTDDVSFVTRKALEPTTKSQVSHVTLDGQGGNTWEQILALHCELSPHVTAYVKNDHLGFVIPYVHQGRTHSYLPDFLVRLERVDGDDLERTLIVEVSGGQKSPGRRRPRRTPPVTVGVPR